MTEVEVEVVNALGIHARPASLLVQTAKTFKSRIWIEKEGMAADAKSIMSVMMLAAAKNSHVRIRADGADEREAVSAMAFHFQNKFNES